MFIGYPVPYEGVFPLDAVSELAFVCGGDDDLELVCPEDKDETEHFGNLCVGDSFALAPTQPDDHFDAEVANGLPLDCFVIASDVQRGESTLERYEGEHPGDDAAEALSRGVWPCAAADIS